MGFAHRMTQTMSKARAALNHGVRIGKVVLKYGNIRARIADNRRCVSRYVLVVVRTAILYFFISIRRVVAVVRRV